MSTATFETIIIGAGAAGLHCAAFAAKGGRTLVIDHAKKPGEKIRISGGGRCNFTNIYANADNFISENPHFAKSALARYTQWDFIDLIQKYGIATHEKTLGQQFCDGSAQQVIDMLLAEMAPAELILNTTITDVSHLDGKFTLSTETGRAFECSNLIVACGGKSIPKMGATGFGYQLARQFGHDIEETRPGLVPLTFGDTDLAWMKPLAGLALPARIGCAGTSFDEALLFTHRGLSGPAILQISSYWHETLPIHVNFHPTGDLANGMIAKKHENGRRGIATVLADFLPNRLAATLCDQMQATGNIAQYSDAALQDLTAKLQNWPLTPIGTEGYRTAEVTLGGVNTDGLKARTMESKTTKGLYFIGEVVDVTGWLGGYNFQWAWSSAHAAGTAIAKDQQSGD